MPALTHGAHRVGDVEIVALCDGIAQSSNPLEESFPGVSPEDWAQYRADFPDVFDKRGRRWRFHVHAFLVRTPSLTVLVDTGVGPADAPVPQWAGTGCGRVPKALADAKVRAEDIGVVVLTHVHDDHFGGLAKADRSIAYPNARHLMHAADWGAINGDAENEVYVRHHFAPVREAGLLEFIEDGHGVAPGITVVHTPGHTPGHVSLVIQSRRERAIVAGDVLNHPGQVADRFPSGSDADPGLAADTRERLLSRVERERIVLSTAHLTEPFGHVELEEGRRVWRPLA